MLFPLEGFRDVTQSGDHEELDVSFVAAPLDVEVAILTPPGAPAVGYSLEIRELLAYKALEIHTYHSRCCRLFLQIIIFKSF
jgi:hypothetical protein